MADEEDVLRAAGLGSDDSDDEPALERPTAGQADADAAGPAASTPGPASEPSPARDARAETLRAAGLDDSDEDGAAGSAGGSQKGDAGPNELDGFEQAGAPATEELKPGAVQRMTGPPEVRRPLHSQQARLYF